MFIKVLSKNNKSYIINTDYIVKMYEHEDHTIIIFNNNASISLKQNYEDFLNTLIKMGVKITDVSR